MTEGLYRSGNSLLHRMDPLAKLILTGLLIVCLFSDYHPVRLGVVALVWFAAMLIARQSPALIWRVVVMMKWLLLFTLLLHMFFTPGRTLFGVSWLTYDGLVNGLCVDAQILLAIFFSLLLSWTTPPADMAQALALLLAPLKLLRVPVSEIAGMLMLVLHFLPLIKVEAGQLQKSANGKEGYLAGIRKWAAQLEALLLRLFDRADQVARDIVAGDLVFTDTEARVVNPPCVRLLTIFCGVLTIALLWLL